MHAATSGPQKDPSTRSPLATERGFSIVEVIIAALVLAVVMVGATAMFAGTTHTTASTKVRDKQTALANQMLAKLQGDPSWATWCRSRPNPSNCNLGTWMRNPARRYDRLGTLEGGDIKFVITAVATGTDLAADGTGAADEDGVRPDLYRLEVTIAPNGDTARRFTGIDPMIVRSEYNPSIRVQSGRVSVDACRAVNQVDERVAIGDCTGGPSASNLLPPPTLDTSSASAIRGTCDGPRNLLRGSDDRDCVAFKCADWEIAAMSSHGLDQECSTHPGWTRPSNWLPNGHSNGPYFTKMTTRPVTGSIRLRSVRTGRTYGPVGLVSGRAEFRDLPVGEYEVLANVDGSSRLWRSKSVPSTQRVAVEAGLNSRAVLVFRPQATGRVVVPVRSLDGSIPWDPRPLTGWVSIDKSGNVVQSNARVKLCLVPVPQGRLIGQEIPCGRFPQRSSTTEFTFTGVEPGLYAATISDGSYNSFLPISGTAGFLWVRPNGTTHQVNSTTAPFEYVQGLCAEYVRDTVVGDTWDPVNDVRIPPVQPCDGPSGAAGPGGGGGGGTQ